MKTPNIDKLATEGIRFTNWYSNSPVCSPSRASLLTGKYPLRTEVDQILSGKRGAAGLSAIHDTLPSICKENGYRTAMFGKWHLGTTRETRPNTHGFDEFFLVFMLDALTTFPISFIGKVSLYMIFGIMKRKSGIMANI